MSLRYFILKALCLSICLALSSQESAQEFIKKMLQDSNSQNVLNSVLQRLNQNRQRSVSRQRLPVEIDYEVPSEGLPQYMQVWQDVRLQDLRERALRQSSKPKYSPICLLDRKVKNLNTDQYEYRPAHYDEVICTPPLNPQSKEEVCSSLGFECVQLNTTINLTRRPYHSDCWESVKLTIPAACECMWPTHKLGDIKAYNN